MECRSKILLKSGIVVPCGKCPICLANQRAEWVFRLQQEFFDSSFAIFVTLTYNDENLPADLSVNKRDVQLFHKRLRKHFPPSDLRFYLVSEYGDHTYRPHYHGLYFFKSVYDKRFIYDTFTNSWNNGFCSFGDVEEGSIVYCTKYCLKRKIEIAGRAPTFRLVSKMSGGLGAGYISRMGSYHIETDNYSFVSSFGKRCRMPKYYKDTLIGEKFGTKNNPLYLRYSLRNEEETKIRVSDDFVKGFKSFISGKHFATLEDAKNAFNAELLRRGSSANELVLKHCKKQKL